MKCRQYALRMGTVEFFADDQGRQPAKTWLRSLDFSRRAVAIAAIEAQLAEVGLGISETEHGDHLGEGLLEFTVRYGKDVQLHIFCHADDEEGLLLLGGCETSAGADGGERDRQVEFARQCIRSFELSRARERLGRLRRAKEV